MKQKLIYIVNAGVINSIDPNSGFEQLDEVARFTNLKAALECYNSIKRATDWSAPWGVTEVVRYDADEKAKEDAEDSDYDADATILRCFYQPQRGNNKKAFESK